LAREQGLPVIVMTAYATLAVALAALRAGAADLLPKPFGLRELEAAFARLGESERRRPRSEASGGGRGPARLILGCSEAMARVHALAASVAPTKATVLLTGESGTGKELVAAAIHAMSRRAQSSFVKVNCAAITDTLLESTLFGHEKGAFTGAIKRTPGKFELAQGGTLLLDEISEMKVELQSKLLRVLQEREFELVGGTRTLPVDVRIIATSNRNLKEAVRRGQFRDDLYFRLSVVPIHLPPLREHREDIPDLVRHFVNQAASENGLARPELTPVLLRDLQRQTWPGNIRQLQNAVERAVVMAQGQRLELAHFLLEDDLQAPARGGAELDAELTLKEMEQRMIMASLARFSENRTQAARHLGISVRTLRNKLNLYREQNRRAGGASRAATA
ncbi:sigma-54-dependent Fis family transcriptional regulator, partial [bacterium]|nr:sigma-54-dependent Fis family transcriptional regulator [bacterium]